MPELPEVEVTRIGLSAHLLGARVLGIRLGKPLRWPLGCEPQRFCGLRLGELQRRGKYLWLPTVADAGEAEAGLDNRPAGGGLLMHLGMSGSLAWLTSAAVAGAHDHFDLLTDRGLLRLNDPRRFGAVVWSPAIDAGAAARLLAALGPEPFDPALTPVTLQAALRRRRSAIKTVLLSGDAVVGVGNIYASEALHRAGIDPRARSDRLSLVRCARLLEAIREVLARAIGLGGSTLRDFRDVHGMSGAFQQQAAVYGREGQPCSACGGVVRRIVQAQRASYFCPRCQRR